MFTAAIMVRMRIFSPNSTLGAPPLLQSLIHPGECMLLGPVTMLGDFNAHLRDVDTKMGAAEPNVQSVLLQEIDAAVSLASESKYIYAQLLIIS